jgi:hypothetical protein
VVLEEYICMQLQLQMVIEECMVRIMLELLILFFILDKIIMYMLELDGMEQFGMIMLNLEKDK